MLVDIFGCKQAEGVVETNKARGLTLEFLVLAQLLLHIHSMKKKHCTYLTLSFLLCLESIFDGICICTCNKAVNTYGQSVTSVQGKENLFILYSALLQDCVVLCKYYLTNLI